MEKQKNKWAGSWGGVDEKNVVRQLGEMVWGWKCWRKGEKVCWSGWPNYNVHCTVYLKNGKVLEDWKKVPLYKGKSEKKVYALNIGA